MSEATQNLTLMQYSCDSHNLAAVELLLAAGIDPNQNSFQNSWSPLLIAAQHGDTAILRLLVCHPKIQLDAVDHAQSGLTALHKVARRVHVDKSKYLACLRLLLSQAAHADETFSGTSVNVNAQDLCGNTALHYAAISGASFIAHRLLIPVPCLLRFFFFSRRQSDRFGLNKLTRTAKKLYGMAFIDDRSQVSLS